MKVLYAIQGTGNGHISRAREIIPILRKFADVDIFLSGGNSQLKLPFEIDLMSKGISFEYNQRGGLNYFNTLKKLEFRRVIKEIRDFPVKAYDLIINDFEAISAWAAWYHSVPSISLSHQVSLLSDHAPEPTSWNPISRLVLKKYAPAPYAVGLHFKNYDDYIFTPVIRNEVRNLTPRSKGHYTVYLPAVGDKYLIDTLQQLPDVRWEVFSTRTKHPYLAKNVSVRPASNEQFLQSMANSEGLLTGAGFESPAEALYLQKKLFVIPIKGQYEQACNAAALKEMGVPVATSFNDKIIPQLEQWLGQTNHIQVHYPDITEQLIEQVLFDQDAFLLPTLAVG